MEGNAATVQFIKATGTSVISFFKEARNRVVIANAGYFADAIRIETLL